MGNRAIIALVDSDFDTGDLDAPAIYLHWNGGRDSVEGFLRAAKEIYGNAHSAEYGAARLTTIICNWLTSKDDLSVGVGHYGKYQDFYTDNGVYWVNTRWQIIRRDGYQGREQYNHPIEGGKEHVLLAQPSIDVLA